MVRIESPLVALTAAVGALGALAMISTAATALADPAPPLPGPNQPVQVLVGDPAPTPPAAPAQPLSGDPAPEGVPHLPSPENLPPGTTEDPTGDPQGHGMSYLRELWHAVQTQDVSGGDALLLLTQRPMDASAIPPAGLPTGPQGQAPANPALPVPPADPLPAPTP